MAASTDLSWVLEEKVSVSNHLTEESEDITTDGCQRGKSEGLQGDGLSC